MKLAIVGLGHFNTREHAPSILHYIDAVAPVDIVLCETNPERLRAWQQRFGTYPSYAGVEAMLATEKPDAALVTVPPEATCGVVETLLGAGVPTFTEKPPGLTVSETRRLIAAAGDLPHAVGFNRRFVAVLRRTREIVRDAGGDVLFIGCEFHRANRYDPDFTTTLIHGIDALRSLGGDFAGLDVRKPLVACERPFRNWLISGTFRSGALCSLTSLPVSGRWVERYTLVLRDLTVVAQLSNFGQGPPGEVRVFRNGQLDSTEDDASLGVADGPECIRFGVYDEVKQFLDAVCLGGDAGTSFREALQSVEVAEFLRNCPDDAHWTGEKGVRNLLCEAPSGPAGKRFLAPFSPMLKFTGRIYTGLLDPATTDALLVGDDGKIAAVGADAKRADAREIALGKRVIVPGFIDAHVHIEGLAQQLTQLLLADATSLDDVLERVRERAASSPENEVIVGTAWDEGNWSEPAIPTRETLDAVAPNHVVVLRRVCGHLWAVNSKALGLVAVRDDLSDAQRERLKAVADDGVLREGDIALASPLAVPSPERMRDGLAKTIHHVLSMGATTLQDMGSLALGAGKGSPFLEALRELDDAGKLPVRVVTSLHRSVVEADDLTAALDCTRGNRIHPGPVKVFLDGSIGAQTAAVSRPFDDSPGNTGQLLWKTADLERVVSRAHAAGLQLALHAIGDRAIEQALDVLGRVLSKDPRDDHRHRIEHVEIVTREQIERMGQLGVIASMQPNFVGRWQGEGGLYAKRLGARKDTLNPLRSMRDAGVRLAFGSDGMPFGPLYGIRSAMHHTTPSESLSFVEALHAYTLAAAFAGRIDDFTGSLEVGKIADFVILSADPARDASASVEATYGSGTRLFPS